ncbi:MAG: YfhO family protein [Bacteroidales bacterium]|nr:YfhO family protein [Bacteroidales bacterium]
MNFKKILPHIIAVVAFIVVSLVFFSPVMEGKKLFQSDMAQFDGASKELHDYEKASGEGANWANAMFSGMPSYQIAFPQSNNIFNTIAPPLTLWNRSFDAGIFFIMMLGFYVFMCSMGAKPLISAFSALIYALGSYNVIIITVGHITKAWAMAMIAPILAGMILVFKRKYISGIIIFTLSLGLQIYFNHIQITYYTLIAALILGITYLIYAIKEKQIKNFALSCGALIIAAVIAVMPNSSHLALNAEYAKHTMRGGSELTIKANDNTNNNEKGLTIDYAYAWSYGVGETLTMLIPDFRGGGSSDNRWESLAENRLQEIQSTQPAQASHPQINQVINQYAGSTYWGEQPFTAGTVYFGAIVIFLSLLGFLLIKGAERWWLLFATIVSILMSWGSNFMILNEFLFNHLPLYNKFRTPSMILVIANVTLVITAFLGLKEFFNKEIDNNKKTTSLFISGGIVGGFCLLCALLPDLFASFTSSQDSVFETMLGNSFIQALYEDRKSAFTSDALRSFIFIAIAFVSLFLFAKDKLKKEIIVIVIIGIASVIDLWQVDKRYISNDNYKKTYELEIQSTPALETIKADVEAKNIKHYRVYNMAVNTFNDASTSFYVPSIGGYHGAKLQRYQDIISFHLTNPNYVQKDLNDTSLLKTNQIRQFFYTYQQQIKCPNLQVLNMLDTKYFILPVGQEGGTAIENPEACGAAWFVENIKTVNTADEEILALNDFNPQHTAILNKEFASQLQNKDFSNADQQATITLQESPNKNPDLKIYKTKSTTSQLCVFSEIYYKEGWKAYIDGKEAPILRANYVLRALEVPAGEHTIELRCEPDTLKTFNIINLIGSILIVVFVIGAIALPFIKKKK